MAASLAMPFVASRGQELDISTGCVVPPRSFAPEPQAAVSLKAMAEKARSCGHGCSDFNPMGGLTRLDGFVADRQNADIVLWGLSEPDAPPLMYDDFVVAIRAAAGRYYVMENGRRVVSQTGISIDADPRMWGRLDDADLTTPEGQALYKEICDTPMRLRVDGMPRHTRVSDILLAADYRMKLVNQGKATIPIEHFFRGISERNYERNRFAIRRGATYARPDYDVNRYWFSAGAFKYQSSPDGSTAFMETAQVVLNQVAERSNGSEMVSANVVAADERDYVCDWNQRMDDTFRAEQIWREMYNVFRHFALARILVDSGTLGMSGLDTRPLLDTHQVKSVHVPDSLPGSSYVIKQEVENQFWFVSTCGGVNVDVADNLTRGGVSTDTQIAGSNVLAGRTNGSEAWSLL